MPGRITQHDVAAALGLHVSTVSKALLGDPRIAAGTRDRVRRCADALGYAPDPMLSSLCGYRAGRRPPAFQAAIAWIHNHPRRTRMEQFAAYDDYLAGARLRAARLGYTIDEFWCGDTRGASADLARTLHARGISIAVIGPQAEPDRPLALPWERLCAVAVGYTLPSPALHRVTNDHFGTMTTLVERLSERGYRRIACHVWEEDNRRMGLRAASAFAAYGRQQRVRIRIVTRLDRREFLQWIRTTMPDAVICREPRMVEWLRGEGIAVPGDMGAALYALDPRDREHAGMVHHNDAIGAAAVDLAVQMYRTGEPGPPTLPRRVLIEGGWRAGTTVRPLARDTAR